MKRKIGGFNFLKKQSEKENKKILKVNSARRREKQEERSRSRSRDRGNARRGNE